ncbi:MAG: ImmA/IrrE family metallo-endopeptidase [Synergistaceae bacterium]|nr:ImmA/IrrE family metallo-endopeptidase [Synergistaceae bacterium]
MSEAAAQAAKAAKAAKELLDATLPLMKAPPVNLRIICDWLEIEVYMKPCDSFGAIFSRSPRDGRKVLLANDRMPQGRFRFSIAHELGHILLNHEPLKHIYEQRKPAVERQADFFAAELLLPEHLLRRDCAGCSVPELARLYKVSRQSLELRLNGLGLVFDGGSHEKIRF